MSNWTLVTSHVCQNGYFWPAVCVIMIVCDYTPASKWPFVTRRVCQIGYFCWKKGICRVITHRTNEFWSLELLPPREKLLLEDINFQRGRCLEGGLEAEERRKGVPTRYVLFRGWEILWRHRIIFSQRFTTRGDLFRESLFDNDYLGGRDTPLEGVKSGLSSVFVSKEPYWARRFYSVVISL